MSDQFRPIETTFKGYRFRSRLEARWAVVLDYMGVRFDYELEGFHLPDGSKYLPDFFVPAWDCFLEVKRAIASDSDPDELAFADKAIAKSEALAAGSGKLVLTMFGLPDVGDCTGWASDPGDSRDHGHVAAWVVCKRCGVLFATETNYDAIGSPLWKRVLPRHAPHDACAHDDWFWSDESNFLGQALLAGKRARFEFGERG